MLFGRVVPCDVMEVVVDGRVAKLAVADHGVEVALGGGHEVGVVHEHLAREIVPPHDGVFHERSGKGCPRRSCSKSHTARSTQIRSTDSRGTEEEEEEEASACT